LRLSYVTDLTGPMECALGVFSFGHARPDGLPQDCPHAAIDLRPIGRPALYEIWEADQVPIYGIDQQIRFAMTPDILLATLTADTPAGFADITAGAYERIFAFIEKKGFPYLLRIWNYFPKITGQDTDLERYHEFSIGRHRVFTQHGKRLESAPAASALGSRSGPLTITFIAGKSEGQPIENPRQISAYHYPTQYGPKSPVFSRALICRTSQRPVLFLSGTASIVGHESCHEGALAAQLEETLANIDAVCAEAHRAGLPDGGRFLLKVYIRDGANAPEIEERVRGWLGQRGALVCLEADICRKELLVEIEGYYA
jgi:enamine deaminase RidA (YjgF/YER057c/UK114 family)